jgi:F420-dependent oxidoreductase-like protein
VTGVKLGLNLGYWGAGSNADNLALAQEADTLGYSVVWAAEAYGSDSPTVLSYVAAQTSTIDIGSGVMQMPARSPAATAMTAATLGTLSGGRFRLGLGVSGPQVSEGWHGVAFDRPLRRTREYVEIVQMALRRARVSYDGEIYQLPLPDGPGKALRLTVHPVRPSIPLYLAAVGPQNVRLTGELADGWLSIFLAPSFAAESLALLAEGRARVGLDLTGFDVVASTPLLIDDDPSRAIDTVRPYAALYIGGMGSREQNFYKALATRMGYGEQAEEVQQRYLSGDQPGAAQVVPAEFIDSTALLGPVGRVAERMAEFAAAGVTTLSVSPFAPTLTDRLAALHSAREALEISGAAA